jgi:MFS family permease
VSHAHDDTQASRLGKRLVLAVACMAILLDALDLSITQVALPSIDADLDVSARTLPWVANAYVLTYGGLLLFGGRLCDMVGRRTAFLAGLAVFGGASLVCGLASNAITLIEARGVQGIGAALTVPAAVAVIAATFEQGGPRERAMGIFAAFASAGFSVGLILSGALTGWLGWPWIFLIKVPVVFIVAIGAMFAIPARQSHTAARSYDLAGAVTGSAGPLLIAFAVTSAAGADPNVVVLLAAAAIGAIVSTLFVLRERVAADPLLPLTLFAGRTVRIGDPVSLTVLAAPFGFAFVTTIYLQAVCGYSPLRTGLALLPGAMVSAVVSRFAAPAMLARFGIRFSGVCGLLIVSAGFGILVAISTEPRYATVVLPASLVCLGIGMGLAYPTYSVAGVADVSVDKQGIAAGIQNAALQIGGGLGFAIVTAVVGNTTGGVRPVTELVHSLRLGAVAGCVLPMLGALAALALPAASADDRTDRNDKKDTGVDRAG